MAGQMKRVLAKRTLEALGETSPSKSHLGKTSWCVKCWRVKPRSIMANFGVKFKDLESCGITLPGANKVEQVQLARDVAQKIPCDEFINQVHTENHILQFRVDEDFFKKEILCDIIKKDAAYGLDGPPHLYKWDKTLKTVVELPSNQNVLVEYGSPNIAKPFHAGHLRSTILGQFVANLNNALGHNVTRINYLGDWGTQYGYLGLAYEKYGSEKELQEDPLEHLFNIYVKINQDCENDNNIHEEAKEFFNKMERGEEDKLPLWKRFRDISIEEYNKLYQRLGIQYDEYHGESMYRERCQKLIEQLRDRNVLQFNPETNVGYIDLREDPKDSEFYANVLKSDGSSLYLTRDVAAFIHRREKYKFDRIHYLVEQGQHLHFRQLQEALRVIDEPVAEENMLDMHVKFGRITGMSTRKGEVVFLKDILDEAQKRMIHIMKTTETTKVTENLEDVADVLGVSAIIVQDLKHRRGRNYPFSWEKMLRFHGDTGVYLQYAHARLVNLEKNCGVPLNIDCDVQYLSEDVAGSLIRHLARYDEAIHEAFVDIEPYLVASYLFELGRLVNSANQQLRVKDQPAHIAEARLLLFHCARLVLRNGMRLLGLKPLDKL